MTNSETLTAHFGQVAEGEEFQQECQNLMKQFTLSAEELYYKWESYVMRQGDSNLQPSCTELRKLQDYIMAALEKENRTVKKPRKSLTASARKHVNSPESFLDNMLSTPASRKRKLNNGSSTQTPSRVRELRSEPDSSPNKTPRPIKLEINDTPFKQRKEAGKTVEMLNEGVVDVEQRVEVPKDNVVFQLNVDLKRYSYRTMRMKLSEVAEYFDDKIEQLIEALMEHSEVTDEHIGNPATMTQSEIVAVGRIIADSVDKLNPGSMLFETCRRVGAGMQTRLDVSNLPSYSFFPGQVLALRGQNNDGKRFAVMEVIESPLPKISAATSKIELDAVIERQTAPASVITAAGPFTTTDNLYYEPLDALVAEINQTHPDVVILVGPLLDITHPKIQSGDFEIPASSSGDGDPVDNGTLEDLFRAVVAPKLNQIESDTTVVVIPSVRDAMSGHAAFPQPAFDRKQLGLDKHFKCLSNPATFSLNEVVFAVNSIDAIRDVASTMTQHNPQSKGLYGAINHILESRSMYPVFPAPQKYVDGAETNGGTLDIPFMGLAEFTHAMPDVLITPSMTKPLAEVASNVVVCNPGLLSRRTGGGTYAHLTIKPPSQSEEDPAGHEIWNRARVNVKKL